MGHLLVDLRGDAETGRLGQIEGHGRKRGSRVGDADPMSPHVPKSSDPDGTSYKTSGGHLGGDQGCKVLQATEGRMKFHLANATKALLSVDALVRKGHSVVFAPSEFGRGSYIELASGRRIDMEHWGGEFIPRFGRTGGEGVRSGIVAAGQDAWPEGRAQGRRRGGWAALGAAGNGP